MEPGCIVHDRKYLSKFHGSVNQLRQKNEFPISILQQLSKRCCSCRGKTGESSLTVENLRQVCLDIQTSEGTLPVLSNPVKPLHYVALEFPSTLTHIQRKYKSGRFVGRSGEHLKLLERTLNIRINIFNEKSSKSFCRTVNQLHKTNKQNRVNDLSVLITVEDENNVEKVTNAIKTQWENIDVVTKKKRAMIIGSIESVEPGITPTAFIDGDSRWKPKTHKKNDKRQRKQKQNIREEEEVEPQPQVRPLSMPKQIEKLKKTKH